MRGGWPDVIIANSCADSAPHLNTGTRRGPQGFSDFLASFRCISGGGLRMLRVASRVFNGDVVMARVRSPGHPNSPLKEVIDYARKIHQRDRQHPITRETAVQHMGFSGLTGSSDRALASLMHFGLAEKALKGELRISGLALRIIHHDHPDERREALREAAFKPVLFRQLRERYPGQPPSPNALASYLTRLNFSSSAIGPAVKAYLETCFYLQQENAYESVSLDSTEEADLPFVSLKEASQTTNVENISNTNQNLAHDDSSKNQHYNLVLNQPKMDIQNGVARLEIMLDFEGIIELEETLQALKLLLRPRKATERQSGATHQVTNNPNKEEEV